MTQQPNGQQRQEELASRLASVRERLERAAAESARAVPELIVVTKNFPASDARLLADLGVRQMGENRDQEARPKAEELRAWEAENSERIRWHFIGQLQSKKSASVARYASAVHSVDRLSLVPKLGDAVLRTLDAGGRPEHLGTLDVLLQVSLEGAGAEHRGGAGPVELGRLAEAVQEHPGLRLAGLMAVAPLGADPDESFSRLAQIRQDFLADHPGAGMLSCGMSQDAEAAIRHGATHVRIGSDILGARRYTG